MYVSEPHVELKLSKSSQNAKSCFFQQLKNTTLVMQRINILGPCCKDGGTQKEGHPLTKRKAN
jgi:hypothetical protein